ncbi:MAG: hypothetical protein ACPGOY_18275 [Rhodospirillaceae bacterium]
MLRPALLLSTALFVGACAQLSASPPEDAPDTYKVGFAKGCKWAGGFAGVAPINAYDLDMDLYTTEANYREGVDAGMEACGFTPPPGTPSLFPWFTDASAEEAAATPETMGDAASSEITEEALPVASGEPVGEPVDTADPLTAPAEG